MYDFLKTFQQALTIKNRIAFFKITEENLKKKKSQPA
jgi:hypothetical protein